MTRTVCCDEFIAIFGFTTFAMMRVLPSPDAASCFLQYTLLHTTSGEHFLAVDMFKMRYCPPEGVALSLKNL